MRNIKAFTLIVLSSLLIGCSPQVVSNSSSNIETSISKAPKYSEDDIAEEMNGIIDLDTNTYTEEIAYPIKGFEDCKFQITFKFTLTNDNSNSTDQFIEAVEYQSLKILSGWDNVEFNGIESIEYASNHQYAYITWSFNAIKDDIVVEETRLSSFILFNE